MYHTTIYRIVIVLYCQLVVCCYMPFIVHQNEAGTLLLFCINCSLLQICSVHKAKVHILLVLEFYLEDSEVACVGEQEMLI